jgi:CheY-like chemotaxis protein
MCSILLVEDHDDTRFAFSKLLRSWGHEVSSAGSVGSGLAFLEQNSVDVILSDLGLPDGDGCELMTAVRRTNRGVMAIAISAYCMAGEKERTRDAGFDMHFPKPVDLVSLHHVLSMMRPSSAAVNGSAARVPTSSGAG